MRVKIYTILILWLFGLHAKAACSVDLSIMQLQQNPDVPQEALDYLTQRLQNICGKFSFDTNNCRSRFFIAGKFNNSYKSTLPGPPEKTTVHSSLTLYIGDLEAKKIFSTITIDLRGAGTSLQRAYINAMNPISTENSRIQTFMDSSREFIVSYYDENFPSIRLQVKEAEQRHDFKKALWLLSLIPTCSSSYDEAMKMAMPLINKDINQQGELMLLAARTAWARLPNKFGAQKAINYVRHIDPSSDSFRAAQTLVEEIKSRNIVELDLEKEHRHETETELKSLALEVIRDIGVAYGNGQRPSLNIFEFINN